ncbi:transposase [Actinosynnema sp. NPDC023658]|uniref:transposase n=1 Tax=Actinosynnema sp. NPDC023658 TaxID=3155465 RepID=UPI0033FABB72
MPTLPGPGPVHHLPCFRAQRGLPSERAARTALRNRAERQEPAWHKRYAVRSGIEGTIFEFTHGHGMRRCRYRGQSKTHLQHVLTAIAVNIERLSRQPPGTSAPPRPLCFPS